MNEITSSQTFSLTPSAGARIATLLTSEAAPYFRVSVDGGGCSGFQYKFDFDHNRTDDDILFSQHGVEILVDDMSLGFLENAQLDYVEEKSVYTLKQQVQRKLYCCYMDHGHLKGHLLNILDLTPYFHNIYQL